MENIKIIRFEALTAVTLSVKSMVFWVIMACSSEEARLFIETYCLHLQSLKINHAAEPTKVDGKLPSCFC
jgi:hypothetical protein